MIRQTQRRGLGSSIGAINGNQWKRRLEEEGTEGARKHRYANHVDGGEQTEGDGSSAGTGT